MLITTIDDKIWGEKSKIKQKKHFDFRTFFFLFFFFLTIPGKVVKKKSLHYSSWWVIHISPFEFKKKKEINLHTSHTVCMCIYIYIYIYITPLKAFYIHKTDCSLHKKCRPIFQLWNKTQGSATWIVNFYCFIPFHS